MTRLNVAIVGAGIFGLAHAWSAAKRGHRVTIVERSQRASGASIRNFGMVWPIGQPAGVYHEIALSSRNAWLELASATKVWVNPCGSIHLAHRADEWTVLQEFAGLAPQLGFDCELLSAEQVQKRTPAANPQGLLGGLVSSTECCVNPPSVIRSLPAWLTEAHGVEFHFGATITAIDGQRLVGHSVQEKFDRIVVCSGTDVSTLYPQSFKQSVLRLCKLQMMKTVPQSGQWKLGPHLASGLTLRHYSCFEACASLSSLRQRIASETPELDRYGIHVMASQNDTGSVILGDSHEYDGDVEPFDKQVIDELMLRELGRIICLPNWKIAERWHGYYCKNPNGPEFTAEPEPGVSIHTGAGGSGMTMAFGLAERHWESWS